MKEKSFYVHLGRLLYAIAKSDGKVQKEEIQAIRKFISEKLAPAETQRDAFGTNTAFFAEFEFDRMDESSAHPEQAYKSFKSYLEENLPHISKDARQVAYSAALEVARAYKGINQSEKKILEQLLDD
ncbi:MAG: TerB family tellurite resistance protein, partial [Cytophagaceae bacterium]|nr:TerB family tellurite resistance protein [Cytophagaceae bacterium]MDW8456903.1 TerB family tellurite resistance protein [Cytophagaceae bacterium]